MKITQILIIDTSRIEITSNNPLLLQISESLKAVIRSGAHVTHHFISDGHPQHDGLESLSLVTEAALHNNYTNSDHYEVSCYNVFFVN